MISCLLVFSAQLGYIPPELAALGKVSEFVDLTRGEDAIVAAPSYLTNTGKRIYRMTPGEYTPLYTWKIGRLDPVIKTSLFAKYDPHRHEAYMGRKFGASEEEAAADWWLHKFVTLAGLWNGELPLGWQSGYGENGILASSLGWIDVDASGPSQSRLVFFRKEQFDLVSYDDSRKLLYVRDTNQKLRQFKLGKDYRSTREVVLTEKQRREYGGNGGMQSGRWEAYARPGFVLKERDLMTGKSWIVSNGPNQHYVQYAGDDLFTIESLTPRRSVLNLWDREARHLKRIGPYGIFASSPNGRFIVFSASGGNLWLVDRRARRGRNPGNNR